MARVRFLGWLTIPCLTVSGQTRVSCCFSKSACHNTVVYWGGSVFLDSRESRYEDYITVQIVKYLVRVG